ncbi:MAG: hypothetical protein QXN19_01750 [Sulfolobales archaeon]
MISKESAVVVLAFALTVGVYGFIVLNYASIFSPQSGGVNQFLIRSVSLNYYDGSVWRLVIQVGSTSDLDFKLGNVDLRVLVNGVQLPVFIDDAVQVGGDRLVLGRASPFLSSGRVLVSRVVGSSVNYEYVDFIVYVDQANKLNIVIDDDLDSVLDNSYLIRFSSDSSSTYELNFYDDISLVVGKGVTLPVSYLDLLATLSVRPNPAVKVLYGEVSYLIRVSDILSNLRGVVVTSWLTGKDLRLDANKHAYITILIPIGRVVGGDELNIDLTVNNVKVLSKNYRIPQGLSGSGTLIMS